MTGKFLRGRKYSFSPAQNGLKVQTFGKSKKSHDIGQPSQKLNNLGGKNHHNWSQQQPVSGRPEEAQRVKYQPPKHGSKKSMSAKQSPQRTSLKHKRQGKFSSNVMISPPGRLSDSRPATAKNSKFKDSHFNFGERRGSKQPTTSNIAGKYGFNNVRKSHQVMDLSHMQDNQFSKLDLTTNTSLSKILGKGPAKRKQSKKVEKRASSHKKDASFTKYYQKKQGGATDFSSLFYKGKGQMKSGGIGMYGPTKKKGGLKRSNSKHNNSKQAQSNSKISSRRLSSNTETNQDKKSYTQKINNYMSESAGNSPNRNQSTASHPSSATYKKLTDLKNGGQSLSGLLDKSKKPKVSRANVQKSHNTSTQPRDQHQISTEQNMFDRRKKSADTAAEREKEAEQQAMSAHQSRRQSLNQSVDKADSEKTTKRESGNAEVPPQLDIKEDVNIVTKFAFATRVGYIPNNPYKENQDNFILNPNLLKLPACHHFAVADGHGQNGKQVSTYIKKRLPQLIEQQVHAHGDYKKALHEAFITTNTELDYTHFDCQFSGTTLCTVTFLGNKLISANAGDSRAIVVRNSPQKNMKGVTSIQVEQLT